MCGIAGLITFNSKRDASDTVHRMNEAQKHRGPDGAGIYSSQGVTLGHRRLAIIDVEGGKQPFVTPDQSLALTYNGEIYNYVEIARELDNLQTKSDTEVLIKSFERWGITCLEKFRGMFSFVIHDLKRGVVYVVRDRMGIKPLYYYSSKSTFAFASELGSLMASGEVPAEIDPISVAEYFRYQYVPVPRTIYKKVHKLEPGHFLEINLSTGTVKNQKYWELKPERTEKTEEAWREELATLLRETVKMYCRSDVPFGAFLSGGVDSSLVTAMMSEQLPDPVRTFSIGFQEAQYSELPYAKQASEICKSIHFEKVVSADLTKNIMEKLATHFGEPFADSSAIPTYYVSKETAGHVKMVLSGDGGDEIFAGYDMYGLLLKQVEAGLMYELLRPFYRAGYHTFRHSPRTRRIGSACYRRSMSLGEKYDLYRHIFSTKGLYHLLKDQSESLPITNGERKITRDPVSHYMAMDTRTYMLDDILTKVDRMSMANSLEVRVPLLDHKVVELAFNIPLEFKIKLMNEKTLGKKILKEVAAEYYSSDFLSRQKMGFGIPVTEWCRGPLWNQIEERFNARSNPVYEWVHYDHVQTLLRDFAGNGGTSAATVWCLLMFEIWINQVYPTHARLNCPESSKGLRIHSQSEFRDAHSSH